LKVIVVPGSNQAIPPEVEHDVRPVDQVCFSIYFLSIPEHRARGNELPTHEAPELGGETACWAHLICHECGAVLNGERHAQGYGSTTGS
jgi:hypothetical protein